MSRTCPDPRCAELNPGTEKWCRACGLALVPGVTPVRKMRRARGPRA